VRREEKEKRLMERRSEDGGYHERVTSFTSLTVRSQPKPTAQRFRRHRLRANSPLLIPRRHVQWKPRGRWQSGAWSRLDFFERGWPMAV
jgi:hypothetical protein